MISAKKVSRLPVTGLAVACTNQSKVSSVNGVVPSGGSGVGYYNAAAIRPNPERLDRRTYEMELNEQMMKLPSSIQVKPVRGIGKYFGEKWNPQPQLVPIAASKLNKKLMAEEELRRSLQGISAPINSIVREHFRTKPSTHRPVCPLTKEEL